MSGGGGGGGGSNYEFRGTPTGQGNWNTGGPVTGHGSMERGIVGTNSNYDSAPRGYGGESPSQMASLVSMWQQMLGGRSFGVPGGGGILERMAQGPAGPGVMGKMQDRVPGVFGKRFYDRVPGATGNTIPGPTGGDYIASAIRNRGMA
jgi:hypothetical protein